MTESTERLVKALIRQEYYAAEKAGEWWKYADLEQAAEELNVEL